MVRHDNHRVAYTIRDSNTEGPISSKQAKAKNTLKKSNLYSYTIVTSQALDTCENVLSGVAARQRGDLSIASPAP